MKRSFISFLILGAFSCSGSLAQDVTARLKKINNAFMNPNSPVVLVAAHRGAHLEAPENSLAAFKKAIDLGIDIFEMDVRRTKDGKLVIMHDRTVNRTTNGTGRVDSLTFEEIRNLRLKFNEQLTDEKVPTLEEALMVAKGKILVDLDIKTDEALDQIMATVKSTSSENNCFFLLYEEKYVKALKAKDASFRCLMRTDNEMMVDTLLPKMKVEAVHIDPSQYNQHVVSTIKANHARIWINSLDEVDAKAKSTGPAAYEEVLKYGANMIQTDQPALLKSYLIKTGRYY
ncbi:glycerophosphodiester phosphodiesterase family protein [Chitinophagaceae bacterium 26-R-25]|nr:glycerophosphodiester phosphodiesterase family protein [Chitinophagaceae bacterium 26-R-25]